MRQGFSAGTVGVHDSDPYAHGEEAKNPRVIQKQHELKTEQRADLVVWADGEA